VLCCAFARDRTLVILGTYLWSSPCLYILPLGSPSPVSKCACVMYRACMYISTTALDTVVWYEKNSTCRYLVHTGVEAQGMRSIVQLIDTTGSLYLGRWSVWDATYICWVLSPIQRSNAYIFTNTLACQFTTTMYGHRIPRLLWHAACFFLPLQHLTSPN